MMNLEIKGIESQGYNEAANQNGGTAVIDFERAFATLDSRSLELFEAQFSDVTSLSTLAVRRFTSADLTLESDIHTFDVGGMHRAGVVPTRSWSGPRAKASMPAGDIHAPLGVNQVDITPTDGDLLPGMNDHNFYVIVNNFRSDVIHVNQSVYCDAPSDCCAQTLSQQSRPNEEHRKRQRAATEKKSSLGSKDFTLAHTSIFSYTSHITDGQVS